MLVLRVHLLDVLGEQRRMRKDPIARLAVRLFGFVDLFVAAPGRRRPEAQLALRAFQVFFL